MLIRVLGSGCERCRLLTARTTEAVAAAGLHATVEEVHDVAAIAADSANRVRCLVFINVVSPPVLFMVTGAPRAPRRFAVMLCT